MHQVCLGSKGMGKSYLASKVVRRNPRHVIIDPRKEHSAQIPTSSLYEFFDVFRRDVVPINCTISYVPLDDDEETPEILFKFLTNLRGYTIFVDEVDQFCNPQQMPAWLGKLVNFQRHYNVDLIFAARRPAAIHRDITALADEICFFHMHEMRDLAYVSNLCGKKFSDAVYALQEREFMRVQFPPDKTLTWPNPTA